MNKKGHINFFCSILIFSLYVLYPNLIHAKTDLNPQNTVIAFDLHGIILNKDYKEMASHLWNCPHKQRILIKVPHFLYELAKLACHETAYDEYFRILTEDEGNTVAELTKKMALSAQKPNTEVVRILHELKALGYQLDIASNIGYYTYNYISAELPDIFNLFTNKKIGQPTKKPNPQYYIEYLTTFNNDNKWVIFIDDRPKNVYAAEQTSNVIIGIVFKDAEQLRRELIKLGIPINNT